MERKCSRPKIFEWNFWKAHHTQGLKMGFCDNDDEVDIDDNYNIIYFLPLLKSFLIWLQINNETLILLSLVDSKKHENLWLAQFVEQTEYQKFPFFSETLGKFIYNYDFFCLCVCLIYVTITRKRKIVLSSFWGQNLYISKYKNWTNLIVFQKI